VQAWIWEEVQLRNKVRDIEMPASITEDGLIVCSANSNQRHGALDSNIKHEEITVLIYRE